MILYKYYLVYMDGVKTLDVTDITTVLNESIDLAKDYYKRIRLYCTINKDMKETIISNCKRLNKPKIKVFLNCDKQQITNNRVVYSKLKYHYRVFDGLQFRVPKE